MQELVINFLRENRFKITENYLADDLRTNKLIRFVKGSYRYSIVFKQNTTTLHIFRDKLYKKSINQSMPAVSGGKSPLSYQQMKIEVDLSNPDSLNQILNFVK